VLRLVVVADNSLILEAISIGLRRSGEFNLVSHVDGRTASRRSIVDAAADVVLIDEMDRSEQTLELVRQIRAEFPRLALIVLTIDMETEWLDNVFEAGASGAISKATHPVALATLVRETVNGHVVYRYDRSDQPPGRESSVVMTEHSALTSRELEVLRLVAAGSTNGEIARNLWVTEQTVKFHLSNVYRKLDVGNRTEASHYAHAHGLLNSPPNGQPRLVLS
jgi:DNA-binding NarL/FixJ family response regulator